VVHSIGLVSFVAIFIISVLENTAHFHYAKLGYFP
jgi:hypothetical protein